MTDFPKPKFLEKSAEDISVCPFCESEESDIDDTVPQTENTFVYFFCHDCNKKWKRIYKFDQVLVPGHKNY